MVSFRLPNELIKRLEELARETGWTVTDVAQTALDIYVRAEVEKMTKKKPGK